MIKIPLIFLAMAALLGNCFREEWKSLVSDDEMIEYRLQPGQYAVVIVLDEQTTMDMAKKAARHRAAELTVSGGFRYFLIQSETTTRVIKQLAKMEPDSAEMMIEGDFGSAQIAASKVNESVFPALRVVFQCFDKKPKGKSLKACNLIDCTVHKKNSSETNP
ncbi:MAG: hypothetical protein HW387_385 [Parachlamydiales bacterium]|nr:hypothetical protein [Parachlamydiales bacterium]